MMDKLQLIQALINIIQNAVEAMSDMALTKRQVTIKSDHCADGAALITIHNTGAHIAKDKLKHLFEPFFSTKKHGSGIGLALVKRILHSHNGSISVDSSKEAGTFFKIKLPLLAKDLAAKKSTAEDFLPAWLKK